MFAGESHFIPDYIRTYQFLPILRGPSVNKYAADTRIRIIDRRVSYIYMTYVYTLIPKIKNDGSGSIRLGSTNELASDDTKVRRVRAVKTHVDFTLQITVACPVSNRLLNNNTR